MKSLIPREYLLATILNKPCDLNNFYFVEKEIVYSWVSNRQKSTVDSLSKPDETWWLF